MANGDRSAPTLEYNWAKWALQDGTGATDDGVWVDVGPFRKNGVLDVSGITTATIQVFGSNEETKPADATDGRQFGADITANGAFDLGALMRFMKVKISAHTTGTVRADLTAGRS